MELTIDARNYNTLRPFDHLTREERKAQINSLSYEEEWVQALILGDEWANSVTHAFGLFLSFIGVLALLMVSFSDENPWKMISFGVYGATLILLYTASTLYHSVKKPTLKKLMRTIDHCAIYLLIAGSYTPITLLVLDEPWGKTLFIAIWGLAGMGITLKLFFTYRFKTFTTSIYVLMGWLILIAAEPFMNNFPYEGLCWILAGGVFYTGGVVFFVLDKRRFYHAIWHVCVLGGSICHYFAILFYI